MLAKSEAESTFGKRLVSEDEWNMLQNEVSWWTKTKKPHPLPTPWKFLPVETYVADHMIDFISAFIPLGEMNLFFSFIVRSVDDFSL